MFPIITERDAIERINNIDTILKFIDFRRSFYKKFNYRSKLAHELKEERAILIDTMNSPQRNAFLNYGKIK